MNRDNTREQNLLDHYWDADADNRQYIPDELEPSLRETVDQFHAEDDAPEPDQEFVDRLWNDLAGDTTATAAPTSPPWTTDPNDEPTEPQFVSGRQEDPLQTKQQSIWRRRARQIGELVAGVLVLALVTGGLILAYQNLLGTGGDEVPGAGDDRDGLVPNLSAVESITHSGEILDGSGLAGVEIGQINDQDYAFMYTTPGAQSGVESGPELRVVRLDPTGEHELVGSLELDVPWASSIGVSMGRMALVDDVLYLPVPAEERPGLWAVDISDPSNPEEVAFVDLSTGIPTTLAGSSDESMLTVATFNGPLYFIDVSDPADPDVVSAWEAEMFGFQDPGEVPSIAYDQGHVYIGHYRGVRIVDFSEPADIGSATTIENPDFDPAGPQPDEVDPLGPFPVGAWHDIEVVDDILYIAAGDNGVLLYDISDPSDPVELDPIERQDRTVALAPFDEYFYVLGVSADEQDPRETPWTWTAGVFDARDSENPESIGELPDLVTNDGNDDFLSMNTRHAIAGENFLLTVGHSGSLVAHINWVEPSDDDVAEEMPTPDLADEDISGLVPSLAPTSIIDQHGEFLQGAELGSIEIAHVDGQDYAFMLLFPSPDESGDAHPTIRTLRLDPGGAHEVAGELELDVDWSGPMQFNMGRMALVDDVLYAPIPVEDQAGIWAIDVSDPDTLEEISFLDIGADRPMTVVASDDVAVATGIFGNRYVFLDISDPTEPVLSSELEGTDIELHSSAEVPALTMAGDTLYIAHPRGVTMLDVSDPASPETLAAVENHEWEGLEGVEGAGTDTQVEISDDESMLDQLARPDAYHGVAVSGNHAYVAAGDAGVLVFDVSDPSDPQEVETLEPDDRTVQVTQFDEYVYALGVSSEGDDQGQPAWAWSVDALDIGKPADPQIVGQLENLVPTESAEDAAGFFMMSTINQAVSGQDFYLAWGRAGAYVAHIEWVEPNR
ncbi:MAG: hypothetical protein EA415_13050 [Sphaerobacteraceae bacterium]|nr:MAG: hypothetical protein EA415_13050 [Sphaerobacteraceae bacterium]